MQLPIDARNAPFKPKYITDETNMLSFWNQFGTDIKDGTVDIIGGNCGNEDIFVGLRPEQATRILALRDAFCQGILEVLNGS